MRRPASYWFKTERTGSAQLKLTIGAEEESDDLPLVNLLRDDVRQWRKYEYQERHEVTSELLAYWWRTDRARRLFFCQREAVETVIYLTRFGIWQEAALETGPDRRGSRGVAPGRPPSASSCRRGNSFSPPG